MSKLSIERELLAKPGDTLMETIEYLKMSQTELGTRLGKTPSKINDIISGKEPITVATALQLESVLGIDAQFWINSEGIYREKLARIEQEERLVNEVAWAKNQPIKCLKKYGYINYDSLGPVMVKELFHFYGVAGQNQWQNMYVERLNISQFRRSTKFKLSLDSVAASLRIGEIEMSKLDLIEYSKDEFKNSLAEIRSLVRNHTEDFAFRLKNICLNSGVAVVYTPAIPGAPISGITRWLKGNPLIQLTDRYKTNDEFWVSFFHEAGHVITHGKKDIFIGDQENSLVDEVKEQEAEEFAYKNLLPISNIDTISESVGVDKIRAIARENETHPAIVLHYLQKKGFVDYSFARNLKIEVVMKHFLKIAAE